MPWVETMVEPALDGTAFESPADAQSHIAVKPHGARRRGSNARGHLVGQPDAPGLAAVMPWVVPDPIRPGEPFPARRHRLAEARRALIFRSGLRCPAPSKPGPCRERPVHGVPWRDGT